MKKFIKVFIVLMIMGCQNQTEIVNHHKVSFVAVGDNLMHQVLLDEAKTENGYDFRKYYTHIQSYIQKVDLAFVSQETILGGDKRGAKGYPVFNTPDSMASALHDVGFDVVNGATNHALDQGEEGLLHSIEVFKQYEDMTYIGLYDSKEKRDSIEVIEKDGIKIAFLSYNQLTNKHNLPQPYSMNLFDEKLIQKDIEDAKEISDFIIVSCHWGNEYDIKANDFQKRYALLMADLGVDVIIGTHPHTLQPVEYIDGKNGHRTLVAYSLGNFISGMMEEETQLGGMLSLDFVKKGNECLIENVTLTPLINHYEIDDLSHAYETRHRFSVYRLKDYTDVLATQHGLNGYQDITVSISQMKKKVYSRISSDIDIDM